MPAYEPANAVVRQSVNFAISARVAPSLRFISSRRALHKHVSTSFCWAPLPSESARQLTSPAEDNQYAGTAQQHEAKD